MATKTNRLAEIFYAVEALLNEAADLRGDLTQADLESVGEDEYEIWLHQMAALIDSTQVFADPDIDAVDHLLQQRELA